MLAILLFCLANLLCSITQKRVSRLGKGSHLFPRVGRHRCRPSRWVRPCLINWRLQWLPTKVPLRIPLLAKIKKGGSTRIERVHFFLPGDKMKGSKVNKNKAGRLPFAVGVSQPSLSLSSSSLSRRDDHRRLEMPSDNKPHGVDVDVDARTRQNERPDPQMRRLGSIETDEAEGGERNLLPFPPGATLKKPQMEALQNLPLRRSVGVRTPALVRK